MFFFLPSMLQVVSGFLQFTQLRVLLFECAYVRARGRHQHALVALLLRECVQRVVYLYAHVYVCAHVYVYVYVCAHVTIVTTAVPRAAAVSCLLCQAVRNVRDSVLDEFEDELLHLHFAARSDASPASSTRERDRAV